MHSLRKVTAKAFVETKYYIVWEVLEKINSSGVLTLLKQKS